MATARTTGGFSFSPEQINKLMNAGGVSAIGGGLFNLFGGGQTPSDSASKFYNQIPDETKNYYRPYVNSGLNSMKDLTSRYSQLLDDPGSILAQIGKGFKTSPGYEFEKNQGETSINNAARAGGMLGTAQHQEQAGGLAENLANKEFSDYFKNALGLYGTGISGEQGLEEQGFNASSSLAKIIAEALGNQGNLAYEGSAANNAKNSSGISDLLAGGSQFLFR